MTTSRNEILQSAGHELQDIWKEYNAKKKPNIHNWPIVDKWNKRLRDRLQTNRRSYDVVERSLSAIMDDYFSNGKWLDQFVDVKEFKL